MPCCQHPPQDVTFSSSRKLAAKLLESGRYRGHWRCGAGWLGTVSMGRRGTIRGKASAEGEMTRDTVTPRELAPKPSRPVPRHARLRRAGQELRRQD